MGATHFLTKTLPKVAAEMALSVLAYDLTRVMNIVGSKQLMTAIGASDRAQSLASRPTSIEAVFTRPRPLADLLQKVPNTFEPSYRIEGREQRSLIGDRELDSRPTSIPLLQDRGSRAALAYRGSGARGSQKTRVMNIVGSKQLMTAIGASDRAQSLASRPTSIEAVFTRPRPLADLLQKVPNTFEPSYRIEGREQRSLIGDRELDVRCNHVGEPARIADPLERRLELWHTTLLY
ncbi:hypothetical protein AB7M45_006084 [Bradyrhizobium elkanii]